MEAAEAASFSVFVMITHFFSDVGIADAIIVTLKMSLCSTAIASVLGIFLGMRLEKTNILGKKILIRIIRTMMGLPPVVVGLFVYMMTMRKGPLGSLGLLFTLQGMILAQVIIITPIICGMTHASLVSKAPAIRSFAKTMGASPLQTELLVIKELKNELYFAIITGYGRSISEVGAVMLVGGNIKEHTRTMTTTISLLKSQGIFKEGLVLGIMLLLMAFVLQSLADFFRKEEGSNENH